MLKINDNYYDIPLLTILKELKDQLSLNGIYLFNQIKELPEDIMVSCPFHKDGQERKASCGIRKSDGFLHCFACGETASFAEMISRCFGVYDLGQYGLTWLKNNFLGELGNKREFGLDLARDSDNTVITTYIKDEELDSYRYYHDYMFKRKLTEEIINKFDIGYDWKTNCITFPVRDENGNCLFVARRSVVSKFFNYPTNIEKPVYGLYELPKGIDEVVICESMINALTCYVYGKPALALNGTGTEYQIEQLKKLPIRKLILALDPDEAGRKGTYKLRKALQGYKIITEYKIPIGKDVNDLSKEEFENLIEIF